MTDSGIRLLALTILFPVLVIVAVAVALVGCDAQLSAARPPQVLATVSSPFGPGSDALACGASEF